MMKNQKPNVLHNSLSKSVYLSWVNYSRNFQWMWQFNSLNASKNIQVDRSSGQKTAKYGIVRIGVAFLMSPCLSLDYYRTTFCQKLFDVPSFEWILSLMSIDLWRFRLYRSQISFVERCSNYRCCPCVEIICMYVD